MSNIKHNLYKTGNEKVPRRDRNLLVFLGVFYFFFLLMTPFDSFCHIPKDFHTGFYSIVRCDVAVDDGGHFVYLKSLFFDYDIDFINDPFNPGIAVTKTGYLCNPWPIGAAILWSPFFLMGHLVVNIFNFYGYMLGKNGSSFPYISMIAVSSIIYSFIGIFLCYRTVCMVFNKSLNSFFAILGFFSSYFLYYTYIRPYSDSNLEFFSLSLFLYLFTIYVLESPKNISFYLGLGISCGLLVIIRFNGVLYLSTLCAYLVIDRTIRIKQLACIFSAFLIVVSVQIITNKVLCGMWLSAGASEIVSDSTKKVLLNFSIHNTLNNFIQVCVGNSGILLQCPVYILGLIGYVYGFRKSNNKLRTYYISILTGMSVQILLVCTLVQFGCDYGIRYLAALLTLLIPGIVLFYGLIRRTSVKITLSVLLVAWQYMQVVQYKIVLDWNTFSIFKVIPVFMQILKQAPQLLLRSSNFISLVINKFYLIDTLIDVYFLIFIPIFVGGIMVSFVLYFDKLLRVFSSKVFIGIVLLFFTAVSILLSQNPKLSKEEIGKRKYDYSKYDTDSSISIQFIKMDDTLGIVR